MTPLSKAEDAIVIDSMICGVDAMVQRIFPEVKKKIAEIQREWEDNFITQCHY